MPYFQTQDIACTTMDAAQVLQKEQYALSDALYAAYSLKSSEDSPEFQAARVAYDKSVAALEALLGPDANVYAVDCILGSTFSDYYKSVNGFRPRGVAFTRQGALDWMTRQSTMTPGA